MKPRDSYSPPDDKPPIVAVLALRLSLSTTPPPLLSCLMPPAGFAFYQSISETKVLTHMHNHT